LEQKLSDRGIRLIQKDGEAALSTAPEAAGLCEAASKEEFNKDIGRAGLEVLSIVAYQSPASRAGIDYIRGVNSSSTIRNLLIRGLVERKINPKDNRSYLYKPSVRFLQFLGVSKISNLPEYENFKKSLEQFTARPENELAK
jgi:segregation and condensation protein B